MLLKIFAILLTLVLGLCVGSFLNVVIYRLPRHMSLAYPSSHCPKCEHKLSWYENIPLFSYIFLKGKCKNCKCKISVKYPLVELSNMILWLFALIANTNLIIESITPNYIILAVSAITYSVLICVFCCDLENMEIPDELQVCLLILGIVSLLSNNIAVSSRAYGFLAGGGFFALFAGLFYLFKKKEGLGFGDIKLMAVLGLIMGLQNILITTIFASVFGAIGLLILTIKNKGEKSKEYPFATFIVPSAIVSMFLGDVIANWYLSLFAAL